MLFTPVGSIVEKATTPAAWGEKIFVTGIVHGSQLIEVQDNQVTVLWKNKALESYHPDPIVIGNYLYGYSGESSQNRGVFRCLDLPGGRIKWETKEIGWGTVVCVDSFTWAINSILDDGVSVPNAYNTARVNITAAIHYFYPVFLFPFFLCLSY